MLRLHVEVETETFEQGLMRVMGQTRSMHYPEWVNASANVEYERYLWDADSWNIDKRIKEQQS